MSFLSGLTNLITSQAMNALAGAALNKTGIMNKMGGANSPAGLDAAVNQAGHSAESSFAAKGTINDPQSLLTVTNAMKGANAEPTQDVLKEYNAATPEQRDNMLTNAKMMLGGTPLPLKVDANTQPSALIDHAFPNTAASIKQGFVGLNSADQMSVLNTAHTLVDRANQVKAGQSAALLASASH